MIFVYFASAVFVVVVIDGRVVVAVIGKMVLDSNAVEFDSPVPIERSCHVAMAVGFCVGRVEIQLMDLKNKRAREF